jgi:hypothetical protein
LFLVIIGMLQKQAGSGRDGAGDHQIANEFAPTGNHAGLRHCMPCPTYNPNQPKLAAAFT